MNRRKLLTAGSVVILVTGLLAGALGTVLASVPANLFELEGNAVSATGSGGAAPDDWDRVCHQVVGSDCSTTSNTHGATAVAWVDDSAIVTPGCAGGTNCSIFTGGGSKDPIDINQWAWKTDTGGLPDKDNLLHGFAARYSIPSSTACPGPGGNTDGTKNCDMLFFGNDRYDNSGDAQQGFWFFQNDIGLGTNSVGGGSGFTSSGDPEFHHAGDLLLISDFSNGGATSTITVYTWDTTCRKAAKTPGPGDCGDVNLRVQATSTAANCAVSNPALNGFCGIVNPTNGTVSPWSFTDKSANNSYLQGELYEGGVNLSSLGLQAECFASVASETRSSTSTTAVLKDFVLGGFGHCTTELHTTPKDGNGDPIVDTNDNQIPDMSIGAGSVTAKDAATLSVTNVSIWSGKFKFFICGPLTSGTCSTGGVQIGSELTITNGTTQPFLPDTAATLTSVGTYCWRGVFTHTTTGVPDKTDSSSSECFEVLPVTPSLDTQGSDTPANLGSQVSDSATLGSPVSTATQPGTNGPNSTYPSINATNGAAAGGKITFTLLKPNCTDNATGTGTNPQDVTVSGNNTYGPVHFTPDASGTYHWIAQYFPATGDPNNLGSTHNGSCTDTDEDVVVSAVPTSITTRQFVFPQDKAVVSATAGGDMAGTLTFRLYDTLANCTANGGTTATGLLFQPTSGSAISGASPQSATTSNTTYRITSDATVFWRIDFDSTNPAQLDSFSCDEKTAVDFTGDDGTITIP